MQWIRARAPAAAMAAGAALLAAAITPQAPVLAAAAGPAAAAGGWSTSAVQPADLLNRGLIGVPRGDGNLVSWRLLSGDPAGVGFNVYRGTTKVNDTPVSGTGQVIGNASADHRNSSGYVLTGPEFLTVFNGLTGAAMATANFVPPRGTVSDWGDSYATGWTGSWP